MPFYNTIKYGITPFFKIFGTNVRRDLRLPLFLIPKSLVFAHGRGEMMCRPLIVAGCGENVKAQKLSNQGRIDNIWISIEILRHWQRINSRTELSILYQGEIIEISEKTILLDILEDNH